LSNENFPQLVEDFFLEYADINQLKNSSLFLCRQDGVPIYHNKGLGHDVSEASIGALLGGVWQAARALAEFIPTHDAEDVYRLSFDTSSRGLYIVPAEVDGQDYYLGLIYFEELNPGFVKSRLRDLCFRFISYMEARVDEAPKAKAKKVTDYLFNDISDDEMDKLFTISGKGL
jgi:hypothetical protein